jgi:thiamine biosynthesis lipoprotein
LKLTDADPLLRECWTNLEILKELTDGYFDPFSARLPAVDNEVSKKGFDPSGYVKGWVSDRAVAILKEYGATSVQVNSAGDISLAGGYSHESHEAMAISGWKIGIRSPEDAQLVVKIFEIVEGAIATSGAYERGAHIYDPHTGMIAIGAASATVYGPDGGVCEALSTALMVSGRDGAYLFSKEAFAEYGAWVIDRHSDIAWSIAGEKENTLSKH